MADMQEVLRRSFSPYTEQVWPQKALSCYALWIDRGWLLPSGDTGRWHPDTSLDDIFWMDDLSVAKVLIKVITPPGGAGGVYKAVWEEGGYLVQRVYMVDNTTDGRTQ